MGYIILVILSTLAITTLIVLLIQYKLKSTLKIFGIKRWVSGALLYLLGSNLYYLLNIYTSPIIYVLSASLTIVGILIFLDGIYAFHNQPFSLRNNVIITVLAIILIVYYSYPILMGNVIFAITSIVLLYMNYRAAVILIKQGAKDGNFSSVFLGLLFSILAAFSLVMSVSAFFPSDNLEAPIFINTVTSYSLSAFLIIFIVSIIYLNVLIHEKALYHSSIEALRLSKVFEKSPLSHMVIDYDTMVIEDVNDEFTNLTKYDQVFFINKNISECVVIDDKEMIEAFNQPTFQEFANKQSVIKDKNNKKMDVLISASLIEYKSYRKIIISISDISELIILQNKLSYYANHDYLTKLPNRKYLTEKLEVYAQEGRPFAFVALDLNKFKQVNDTHGHYYGDKVLSELARRFMNIDMILFASRVGGDEFVLVIEYNHNSKELLSNLEYILNVIEKPFVINRKTIEISSSIGYSLHPAHGNSFKDLMGRADKQMYIVKKDR